MAQTAFSAAGARAGARVPTPNIVGSGVGTASFVERRVLPHPGVPVPWSGIAGDYAAACVVFLLSRHAAAPQLKGCLLPTVPGPREAAPSGWTSRARVASKSASASHRPREKPGPRHGRGSSLSFPRTLTYSLSPPRCPLGGEEHQEQLQQRLACKLSPGHTRTRCCGRM
ncbi:uncharacterized protein LOC128928285 [Callithrix jacchus]